MRFGILGGTYDPIHVGHLITAETVYQALNLDQVLFAPAGDPPHKQNIQKTPALHRQSMVELAIADNPHFKFCPIDIERPGPHFTVDTVRLIQEQYRLTSEETYFIIGGDSLVNLPTWHQPQQLISLCRLAVVHRPGYQPDLSALEQPIPGLSPRLDWVKMPLIDIASSDIRMNIQHGRSIRYIVSDEVRAYIQQKNLYCI